MEDQVLKVTGGESMKQRKKEDLVKEAEDVEISEEGEGIEEELSTKLWWNATNATSWVIFNTNVLVMPSMLS